ncbi:PREDICTED: 1-phosphatidylinositol 4,5-bisphosphate phosphodiesterase delta-3-A-like [Priapulus caudatus]|uniref:Phosphoinositide phospholipase C n=1 Tax=Priapulus caudatus TaxID=37621 RepID=A0ABM1ETA3_PRICU|nr:PREDICTED: 1-phosphatidylinositol 4,5-bisphosphate phosphodiesterase delta-3-A-like [Priapulus caudatus]
MSSYVERKAVKMSKKQAAEYVEHNKLYISRIYPNGTRTDSSNFDPVPLWNTGCQIVALNYQTSGEPMQLNKGKFLDNGGCGYVRKPQYLLDRKLMFDPTLPGSHVGGSKTLTIRVISAQSLPKPKSSLSGEVIDPYVQIRIHGGAADAPKVKTKVIDDNGFNPIWNEEFKFRLLLPELALVQFSVYDKDAGFKDFIGQYTLPFKYLAQGYRHVTLENWEGEPMPLSTLFVYVSTRSEKSYG